MRQAGSCCPAWPNNLHSGQTFKLTKFVDNFQPRKQQRPSVLHYVLVESDDKADFIQEGILLHSTCGVVVVSVREACALNFLCQHDISSVHIAALRLRLKQKLKGHRSFH